MEKANQICAEVIGDVAHEFIEEFEVDANAANPTTAIALQSQSSSRDPINENITLIGDETESKIDKAHAEMEIEVVSSSNDKSDVLVRRQVDVASGASQMYVCSNQVQTQDSNGTIQLILLFFTSGRRD